MTTAAHLPPPRRLDGRERAVLARTPAAARRVRYLAPDAEAFAAAILARNPKAEVFADAADRAPVEALATDDLDTILARPDAAQVLAAAEVVVAAISPAGRAALDARLSALEAHGLALTHLHATDGPAGYFDDRADNLADAWRAGALPDEATVGTLIAVARRPDARPLLHLRMTTFAATLMDIRTRIPAEAMRTDPDLIVTHEKIPAPLPDLPVDEPKVSVLQRPAAMAPEAWRDAILARVRAGWVVVMEYDDHPEAVARARGRRTGPQDYLRFAHVHAVQTSTGPLVELFQRYNPEVRLLPSGAATAPPFPETRPRTVFYGAAGRGAFGVSVAASLAPMIQAHPDVAFVVVGDKAVFEALPTLRKQFHDYLPYDAYLDQMAACAVSLAPMEPSDLADVRADTKFLEASSRGVLTIASPPGYGRMLRHGRNGLIAETVDDWAPRLAEALENEAASRAMARNAYDYVAGARMFADQIAGRHAWYRDLWDRREALNAALAQRLQAAFPPA